MKAQKSCAAHKHIRKKRVTLHFGRSCWKFRISLKIHQNWQFMKINPPKSEAPFQSLSMIRRSNTEALQYKRQIECNRITNHNQNINKTNEKHVKNYRSPRTPEDGRSLRSSITLWAEQLNKRFLLYESPGRTRQNINEKKHTKKRGLTTRKHEKTSQDTVCRRLCSPAPFLITGSSHVSLQSTAKHSQHSTA